MVQTWTRRASLFMGGRDGGVEMMLPVLSTSFHAKPCCRPRVIGLFFFFFFFRKFLFLSDLYFTIQSECNFSFILFKLDLSHLYKPVVVLEYGRWS